MKFFHFYQYIYAKIHKNHIFYRKKRFKYSQFLKTLNILSKLYLFKKIVFSNSRASI